MPFDRPTLKDQNTRILTDFSSRLIGSAIPLKRSVIRIQSAVWAAATHFLHAHLDWISMQILADTADEDFLLSMASEKDVSKTPATFAQGTVTFSGNNGIVLPAESEEGDPTILQRADGVQYTVDSDATVSGGTVTVNVTCTQEGEIGNSDPGVALTLVSAIAGITSAGAASGDGIKNGFEEEGTEDFRTRYLEILREPPEGGNDSDYERWAKEVSGVTRAWPYRKWMGPGTVGLAFVLDNEDDIIPDDDKVDEVAAHIETVRPLGADVYVFAPTPVSQNFSIQLTPGTPTVRAAVIAEIKDLFSRAADPGGTIYLSQIREAVSSAAGETDNIILSPTTDIVRAPGEISIPGTFIWS